MEDIQNRVILLLKTSGLIDCNIIAPIILHELLWSHTKLVQGWINFDEEICWHVWLETPDGQIIDPLLEMAKSINSQLSERFRGLIREEPEKYEAVPEIIEMFKLYQDNPKTFWKNTTPKIQNARKKIFAKLKSQVSSLPPTTSWPSANCSDTTDTEDTQ